MKKYRLGLLLTAAAMLAAALSACGTTSAEWDDTLPLPATTSRLPEVYYESEETTTTESITVPTRESTSRTAFSETDPELATTTATYPEEDSETSLREFADIPKIPISEFTSTRASSVQTTESTADDLEMPAAESTLSSNTVSAVTGESTLSATVTEVSEITDINAPYKIKDRILRPYSYRQLDEKSAYIYDSIITAAGQYKTDITFSSVMNITADDYCAAYQQLYNDENSIFYIDTKMQYAVNSSTKNVASATIFYKYSSDEIKRMQNAIDAEANRVVAMITPSMTEYDIVKLFYDYLAENVVYDENAVNCRDIYGVFVDKKAICGGYSKAFSYLCDKVGIETLTITGDADEVPHMWNMVKIGGEWYHIDITYAVTDSKLGKYVRYDYFCVDDSVIHSGRSVYEQEYAYPKAASEKCNYYVKNGLMADSWDEVKTMLSNRVEAAAKNKELVAQVRCSSKEVYYEAVYNLFDRTRAQAITIMEDTLEKTDNKYKCDNISYSQDDNTYVIKLFLEYAG